MARVRFGRGWKGKLAKAGEVSTLLRLCFDSTSCVGVYLCCTSAVPLPSYLSCPLLYLASPPRAMAIPIVMVMAKRSEP